MEARNRNNDMILNEDIKDILFRNFAGRPDKYYPNGQIPNFWLVLYPEKAQELIEKGYNVRTFTNRDGDEEYRIKIFARYDKFPPVIYKVCGKSEVLLDENSLVDLDRDEICSINLEINPSHWKANGNEGIRAYISQGRFEIVESMFSRMFPTAPASDIEEDLPWN